MIIFARAVRGSPSCTWSPCSGKTRGAAERCRSFDMSISPTVVRRLMRAGDLAMRRSRRHTRRRFDVRKVVSGLFISLDGVTESPDQWQFDHFDEGMMEA